MMKGWHWQLQPTSKSWKDVFCTSLNFSLINFPRKSQKLIFLARGKSIARNYPVKITKKKQNWMKNQFNDTRWRRQIISQSKNPSSKRFQGFHVNFASISLKSFDEFTIACMYDHHRTSRKEKKKLETIIHSPTTQYTHQLTHVLERQQKQLRKRRRAFLYCMRNFPSLFVSNEKQGKFSLLLVAVSVTRE